MVLHLRLEACVTLIFTVCREFYFILRIILFDIQIKSSFIYHLPVSLEVEHNIRSYKALHKAIKIVKLIQDFLLKVVKYLNDFRSRFGPTNYRSQPLYCLEYTRTAVTEIVTSRGPTALRLLTDGNPILTHLTIWVYIYIV